MILSMETLDCTVWQVVVVVGQRALWGAPYSDRVRQYHRLSSVCWVPSHLAFVLTSVIYSFPVVAKILAKYLKWYMREEKNHLYMMLPKKTSVIS